MATPNTQVRFFGLNMTDLALVIRAALQDMWRWPLFRWLRPQAPVRVLLPNGQESAFFKKKWHLSLSEQKKFATKFVAILLAEDALLRRKVQLPVLGAEETADALLLEARVHSPFPPDQLAWVASPADLNAQGQQVFDLVLTSRALIQAQLNACMPQLQQAGAATRPPEVWVPGLDSRFPLALPGFGEVHSATHGRNVFRLNVLLLLVACLLATAIALTPTAQLYWRLQDAQTQFAELQQRVAPLLKQREAHAKLQDQWQLVSEMRQQGVLGPQVLEQITRLLPDDTFLQTLQVNPIEKASQSVKVQISGQTLNTAALMQYLGKQAGVSDVRAPFPSAKLPGAVKENFSIEFVLLEGLVR